MPQTMATAAQCHHFVLVVDIYIYNDIYNLKYSIPHTFSETIQLEAPSPKTRLHVEGCRLGAKPTGEWCGRSPQQRRAFAGWLFA